MEAMDGTDKEELFMPSAKIHSLKIRDCYMADIASGSKNFELRKDDRGFEVGDLIHFTKVDGREFGRSECPFQYYSITYILRDAEEYGLEKGYCILGIKGY